MPNYDTSAAASGPSSISGLIFTVLVIAAAWQIFEKAGEHGWAAIVPFYNFYVAFRVAGYNPWLFLLMLIPVVNIVVGIMWALELGRRFGKDGVWSFFLLVVFSFIGLMILGFGSASYQKRRSF